MESTNNHTMLRLLHWDMSHRCRDKEKSLDQFLDPGKSVMESAQEFVPCLLFLLPGLGAVTAGSWRWSFGVTGQGPGVRRRLQPLHVASEEGEQGGGGVAGRLPALALQQLHQEVDVAHGQAQDLVLAQLLLRGVGGDELAELGEGGVDVVLAPALPRVGEHLPGHGFDWSCRGESGDT